MSGFKWNPGAEREIERMAIEATQKRFQPILDSVHDEYAGRSVDEIKPVLARKWAAGNDGASITDPELTNIAQAISDGTRVILRGGHAVV